jgi:ferredoxin
MSTIDKSTFNHFFNEDAEIIKGIISGDSDKKTNNKTDAVKKDLFPKIKRPKEISEEEFKSHWRELRSFFRNSNNTNRLPKDLFPAIMAPLFTNKMVGTDFPVWVADEEFKGETGHCLSLKEILTNTLYEIAPGEEDAHILKENIERMLHIANDLLKEKSPQLFQSVILQVLDQLEKQLDVSGDEVQSFNKDLKNLKAALPNSGALLSYSNNTSLQILDAAIVALLNKTRKDLKHDIKQLKCRLNDLLRVEREKGPERKNPDKMKDSLGFVDDMMNFGELSSILPGGGAENMGEERTLRIAKVVKDLEEGEAILDQQGFLFIDDLLANKENIDWKSLFGYADIKKFKAGKGCDSISSCFNDNIDTWTQLFIAKRIGELEFENKYQADVHDEFYAHFTWESLSKEELNACPQFIMIVDDVQLFDAEFNQLSKMLSSNIPVKIVALKQDNPINASQNGSAKKISTLHAHTELGALMLSYKNIYVAQSTSITPKFLFNGFTDGLNAFAPAFFYLLNVDEKVHENPYLYTSAVVESRDFPGFTFNGLLGTPWGSRFGIDNNPQPEFKWPNHELTITDANGNNKEMEFPFTFADQAVLNSAYHKHFSLVDAAYWNENLIPITDYMENSIEDNISNVPFIWMMNTDNELQKVAVSWPMVLATQERQDFWRFLQENSGINNYHVELAVEKAKVELQEEHNKALEDKDIEYRAEIQDIRDEEAGKVMENLTSILLNLDTTNVVTPSAPTPAVSDSSETDADDTTGTTPEEVPQNTGMLSNDPYIDTAMCTSCNECINMNGKLFIYNADKMAEIGDPAAGTFLELVEAAELCPVAIIHPGSPLNPDEADLESLVERAAKFN